MQRAAQNFIRKFLKKYSFSQNGKSLNQHQKQSFRDVLSKRCSQKFNKIHRKTRGRLSFLIKLQGSACSCINKETLAQVFSYEFWEISKNTFLHRAPLVAASAAFCFFFFDLQISDIFQARKWRLQLVFKVGILKNFTILTLKHLCSNLFLSKLHIFMQLPLKYIQNQTYRLDFDGILRICCGIT